MKAPFRITGTLAFWACAVLASPHLAHAQSTSTCSLLPRGERQWLQDVYWFDDDTLELFTGPHKITGQELAFTLAKGIYVQRNGVLVKSQVFRARIPAEYEPKTEVVLPGIEAADRIRFDTQKTFDACIRGSNRNGVCSGDLRDDMLPGIQLRGSMASRQPPLRRRVLQSLVALAWTGRDNRTHLLGYGLLTGPNAGDLVTTAPIARDHVDVYSVSEVLCSATRPAPIGVYSAEKAPAPAGAPGQHLDGRLQRWVRDASAPVSVPEKFIDSIALRASGRREPHVPPEDPSVRSRFRGPPGLLDVHADVDARRDGGNRNRVKGLEALVRECPGEQGTAGDWCAEYKPEPGISLLPGVPVLDFDGVPWALLTTDCSTANGRLRCTIVLLPPAVDQ